MGVGGGGFHCMRKHVTVYKVVRFDEADELFPTIRKKRLHALVRGQHWFGARTQLCELGQVSRERSGDGAVVETGIKVLQLLRCRTAERTK